MADRVQCECGSVILQTSLKKHGASQKHIAYVERHRLQRDQERVERGRQERERRHQERERRRQEREERQERRSVSKRTHELECDVREQRRMFELYERKKKADTERVEKRGLPRHIVDIVMKHTDEKTCTICFEDLTPQNVFMTRCGHMMCKGCEYKMFEQKNARCPTCRSNF